MLNHLSGNGRALAAAGGLAAAKPAASSTPHRADAADATLPRSGRHLKSHRVNAESYSYSYDSYDDDDDDESYDYEEIYQERKRNAIRHGLPVPRRGEGSASTSRGQGLPPNPQPRVPTMQRVQDSMEEVISPLLGLTGAFGFLAAVCSLASGLLALCGAASSHTTLLRASAATAGVAALGGLALAVGSGVVGGLLVSGGELFYVVLQRAFPIRSKACEGHIFHYSSYVGYALLGLAANCAVGAAAAIATLHATCKLATVCAVSGPAADASEQLSLVAGSFGSASVCCGRGAAGRRTSRTTPSRAASYRRSGDAGDGPEGGFSLSAVEHGLAMGAAGPSNPSHEGVELGSLTAANGCTATAPLRRAPEDAQDSSPDAMQVAHGQPIGMSGAAPAATTSDAADDPFPPVVVARPLQPPPACGAF